MKLYLVQHGDALSKDVDPNRPLSQKGEDDIARMSDFLEGRIDVDEVVHSGKTRASKSAERLASKLVPGISPKAIKGVSPNDSVEAFARKIIKSGNNLMVVGHLPFVSKLVAFLTTGTTNTVVEFVPGSMVCLSSADNGDWLVQWMARPELII